MKILILHLSDIHITDDNTPIKLRIESIVSSIKNLDYQIDMGLIIVSGDITFSGQDDEFLIAMEILEAIRDNLSIAVDAPIYCIPTQGNHDCNFSSSKARDFIVKKLKEDKCNEVNDEVIAVCLEPQSEFFQFRDSFISSKNISVDEPLYYQYIFKHEDEQVEINCLNTAWMSLRHETPGTLHYPMSCHPKLEHNSSVVISTFHHPYQWLEPNNARDFREKVESYSDIIFTGHEHSSTKSMTIRDEGQRISYIEGGALHDPNHTNESTFNVLIVDVAQRKQKYSRFNWNGNNYLPTVPVHEDNCGMGLHWEGFQVNQARAANCIEVNQVMAKYLDDPCVSLMQKGRGVNSPITLADIFVSPDVEITSSKGSEQGEKIKGERLFDYAYQNPRILITGESQSGKTTLSKSFFKWFLSKGFAPILIDENDKIPKGDRIFGFFEGKFVKQYNERSLGDFQCLDVGKRVIIVDDYHKLNLSKSRRKEFLECAANFSAYTFLFAQNLALAINEIVNAEGGGLEKDFSNVNILQFNRQRRNLLIENWLMLDGDPEDKNTFAHRLNYMETMITDLLGKNFVPSYPIYVLSVLQASETATQIDTRASTQGYYYEIFIKTALSQGKSNVEYNILETYLAHLAFLLFNRQIKSLNEREFQDFHFAHQNNFDIERSWTEISTSLIEKQIFIVTENRYHFAQKYLYYYFTADYMQDHIADVEIQHRIAFLCQHLYNEEYSNILLFLAHLSKNPIIIEELLNAAEQHFPKVLPAEIEADVTFLNELDHAVFEIVYEDSDHRKNRNKLLEDMDETEQKEPLKGDLAENDPKELMDPSVRLNAALKTLQILGQVLKNFPGSIPADQKYKIANACYKIGLRSLSSMYDLLRENETLILEDFMSVIRVHHPSMKVEEIRKRAKETVVDMGRVVTYGIIKRISGAVGSPELTVTYKRLLEDHDIPSYRLIDAALRLNHSGKFPLERVKETGVGIKGNHLALNTLKLLVVEHLSLFPVPYGTRQKACEAVDVSYSKLTALNMSQNIISK